MKKKNKKCNILLVIFFMGISLSNFFGVYAQEKPKGKPWTAPATAVKMKNPVKADESSLAAGKDIWAQQCKSCHGTKGKGDGSKAEKLEISCGDFSTAEFAAITDGELYWKITEGRKPMPAFNEKLSDTERWQVVNYMRTLAGKKTEPEKSIPLDKTKTENPEKKTEKTKTDTIQTVKVKTDEIEKTDTNQTAVTENQKVIYRAGTVKLSVQGNNSKEANKEKSFEIAKIYNEENKGNNIIKLNEKELLQLKAILDKVISEEVVIMNEE